MTLPPQIDQQIRTKFSKLISDIAILEKVDTGGFALNPPEARIFHNVKTSLLNLLELLTSGNDNLSKLAEDIRPLGNEGVVRPNINMVSGIIHSLQEDYDAGLLRHLSNLIEANIAADYLGQAEQLLDEGQPGKYDHVPAAVLTGAILEDGLRRLCIRQTPPIPITKPNGEPKTLNTYIDDLKKANVFNAMKADLLRGWVKVRNYAAHGEFTQFNRQDVEQMLKGVKTFLADYM
jgi:hypothetical protein